MKCMIAFACLLAVASAGYLGNVASYAGAYDDGSYKGEGYNGLYNGVYGAGVYSGALGYANHAYSGFARAAPFAHAYGYASPRSFGYQSSSVHPVGYAGYGYAGHLAHGYGYAHAAPLALASEARQVDPVAIAAGAPLPGGDTVEVAAAKAVHFQAHAAAKGIAYSAISPAVAYSGYAHAAPIAHAYGYAAPLGLASEARQVDPVAIAAGAPLPGGDTVEVAAAKAFHHQAHHDAKVGHLHAKGHYLVKRSPVFVGAYASPVHSYGYSSYASPLAYSGYSGYGYGGHLGAYYG